MQPAEHDNPLVLGKHTAVLAVQQLMQLSMHELHHAVWVLRYRRQNVIGCRHFNKAAGASMLYVLKAMCRIATTYGRLQ